MTQTEVDQIRRMAANGYVSGDRVTFLLDENDRLRKALERIQERSTRSSDSWRADRTYPTESAHEWHNGYVTCLSTHYLIAFEALDPAGWANHEEESGIASWGTDREWFERTGNCGHCGNPAEDCVCTPADPCGCGPHEVRTEARPCGWCKGTGLIPPRKVTP